jgi:DNA polymerase
MSSKALLAAYLRQQIDIAMPDFPVSPSFDVKGFLAAIAPAKSPAPPGLRAPTRTGYSASAPLPAAQQPVKIVPIAAPAGAANPYAKLSRLKPLGPSTALPKETAAPAVSPELPIASLPHLSFDEKRAIFIELYAARCDRCPLAGTRQSFVFGAGNVDARLMIIGEAPGADEDRQGVPFVGAAGKLLTELLTAAGIDRKKDAFIANVLKCRPPNNRTPSEAEAAACMPLLRRQIEVIAPALLLLLGRTAAQAVLDTGKALGALRGAALSYRGIPVIVTYHPAALLRTAEYRAGTEEDLRRVVNFLKEDPGHAPR